MSGEIEERGPECSYEETFIEPIWSREWVHGKGDLLFHIEELAEARSCPGRGLDEPFQFRVNSNSIKTLTLGQGKTLSEILTEQDRLAEDKARQILEGVCCGLRRLQQGLNLSHGSIHPDNIRVDLNGLVALWSTPPTRFGLVNRWPARILPQPSNCYHGKGDLVSLGLLMYRMLVGQETFMELVAGERRGPDRDLLSESGASISYQSTLLRCLSPEPFPGGIENFCTSLWLDVPEALRVSIVKGQTEVDEGASRFQRGLFAQARVFWEEAVKIDPGSVAAWNNLAVARLARGDWEPALFDLEKAYGATSAHPIIDLNIGTCLLHMGDLASARVWLTRAREMNPWLGAVYRLLSELAIAEGDFVAAERWAQRGVSVDEASRENRGQLTRVLQAQYRLAEARLQAEFLRRLPMRAPLLDNLITSESEPPWGRIRIDDDGQEGGDGVPMPVSPFPNRPLRRAVYEIPARKSAMTGVDNRLFPS